MIVECKQGEGEFLDMFDGSHYREICTTKRFVKSSLTLSWWWLAIPFLPLPTLFKVLKMLVYGEATVPDLNFVARPAAAQIRCYAALSVFLH